MAPSASGNRVTADEPRSIETSHEDMIHDAQLDFHGKRLATCSSDRTIKVFDVVDGVAGSQRATLRGHEGPVWQVAWAHPKFGAILASCSYDGKVLIWKDNSAAGGAQSGGYGAQGYGQSAEAGGWTQIKEHKLHDGSVNSIAWAPQELGAVLACASSDGFVSVATFKDDGTWAVHKVNAHPSGCNAVSWAPATQPGSLISAQQPGQQRPGEAPSDNEQQHVRRFATAGGDSLVKIWEWKADLSQYVQIETLEGHTDWVRDVAFAPNIGLPRTYLASASQDRTVVIWTQDGPSSPWIRTPLNPGSAAAASGGAAADGADATAGGKDATAKFPDTVWRLSWSVSGNVLAVSCGDGKVSLWKENLKGKWECVSEMDS
ncbi:GTPase-activating protein S13 [Tilletia horrida]|uniref:GTPase-activating protein S13 n=1 Tax=Tilletia horrida TaxID=155126 RepID=A0AAN6GD92_9BASI|nr:GTPase-activating protein S13 [Tilletia horrida]